MTSKPPACAHGSRYALVAVLATLGLAACSVEEAHPLTWAFSFACGADAQQTDRVELRVSRGGCPVLDPVFFENSTTRFRTQGSRPHGIPPGIYGFEAKAYDDSGTLLALNCVTASIPAVPTVYIELQSTGECSGQDGWLQDDSAPPEAGFPAADAGVPTNPPSDVGSGLDAGACPDGTVLDPGGVAGCIVDECPDDSSKLVPGACGCGEADTDGDGDGTPDCVDECPMNGNKSQAGSCGCTPRTTLGSGETLIQGSPLCGPLDDSVQLAMESDGNLHLRVDGEQVWASTGAGGAFARMQTDGNLVIRDVADGHTWASGTDGNPGAVLGVHADGTITIATYDVVHWSAP